MTQSTIPPCQICGHRDFQPHYSGPVRDGRFGNSVDDAVVRRCGGCGVLRLDEAFCMDDGDYETPAYRALIGQQIDAGSYYEGHDALQYFSLGAFWPRGFRGRTVADVGAAGGSFLDSVAGMAEGAIAIEPCRAYHETLASRGYDVYAYAAEAAASRPGSVDVATSFQVIEHVGNPRRYLEEIRPLLKDDGTLMISTPNLDDILLRTAPDTYAGFFYRVVHRWYFDARALSHCAELAGYTVSAVKYVHRYPFANYVHWLRDGRPRGQDAIAEFDAGADGFWRGYLEQKGLSDTLFLECRPST